MTSRLIPRIGCEGQPLAASGDGVYIIGADGKRYLDGCGGAAVSCLGHSNAAVVGAICQQLQRLPYAHSGFFSSAAAEQLADMLTALAPQHLTRAYFLCGGSEAVEAALKLARQYFVARGEPQRRYIIGRRQSYHGNTLGALAVGHNPGRRDMFAPLLFAGAHHIAPCHYWREGGANETPEQYGARAADELERAIDELGADNVAAFVCETVVGATLGAVPAVPGYFARVQEICKRHGVLLILDEVMCGTGRTGTMFAFEQEECAPDIVCMAKGIGGGMQPLAALLTTDAVYEAVRGAHGGFMHGHTYISHAAACAAGVATLQEIQQNDLLENVRARGEQLMALLRLRLGGHTHVGDIRGRGLFVGVEFTREGKTPFAAEMKIYAQVKRAAFARGLMVYAMGGCADGARGDHVLLAPPYVIGESEVEQLVDKLAQAVADVWV